MKPIGRFIPTHDTSHTKSPTISTSPSNPEIKSEFLSKSQQQALLSGNAKEIKRANVKTFLYKVGTFVGVLTTSYLLIVR